MTNTETVSTERLQKMLDAEIPLGMSVEDARSIITELLASRTQSPAEWEVDALKDMTDDRDATRELLQQERAVSKANWAEVERLTAENDALRVDRIDFENAIATRDDALEALRAATIPAPERYKEETGEAKIEAFVSYGPLRSYDHEKLMDRVFGSALESLEEVRDTRGNLTGWNIVISAHGSEAAAIEIADAVIAWMVKYDLLDADLEYREDDIIAVLDDLTPEAALETPPLHKEGEAVGYVSQTTLAHLKVGTSAVACSIYGAPVSIHKIPLYAAPVPVPVTITPEQAAIDALQPFHDSVFNDNGDITVNGPYDYEFAVAAYFAHRKLTAALSLKPGEQG